MARRRGDSLPPILVYRVGERHYVIDGHHRVSVERSLDAENIDADVIEILPLSTDPGAPTQLARSRQRFAQPVWAMPTGGRSPLRQFTTRRKPWRPRGWRAVLLFLAAGLALTLLSGAFAPTTGYVLIIAACAFIGHGLGTPVHTGLKDHRQ